MNDASEYDDLAEELVSGVGSDADPRLARVFDVVRLSYTDVAPVVGPELAAIMTDRVGS